MMKWIDKHYLYVYIAFGGYFFGIITVIVLREDFSIVFQTITGWGWGTAISYFIPGILLVLSGVLAIWLKEWFDRRRKAYDWFYNVYITNGIDPFFPYLYKLSNNITMYDFQYFQKAIEKDCNPNDLSESFSNVTFLLDDYVVNQILTSFYYAACNEEMFEKWDDTKKRHFRNNIAEMHGLLIALRRLYLSVTIKNTRDIFLICKTAIIIEILADFEQMKERIHNMIAGKPYDTSHYCE